MYTFEDRHCATLKYSLAQSFEIIFVQSLDTMTTHCLVVVTMQLLMIMIVQPLVVVTAQFIKTVHVQPMLVVSMQFQLTVRMQLSKSELSHFLVASTSLLFALLI